jgi:penicillin-binding protein 1A
MPSKPPPGEVSLAPKAPHPSKKSWPWRIALWSGGVLLAAGLSLLILIAVALAVAFPNLPDISDLADYRPKLPLRVFSAEGVLIGEFGEERRHLTPIK